MNVEVLNMKILRVINSLNPEYGGPIAAAISQSAEMLRQGHTVDFVTLDADNTSYLVQVPGIVHAMGPSMGKYGLNFRLVHWLKDNAWRYDSIIVHGLWQFHSFATWLASRQAKFDYFVYTHGMLDPWFKRTYPFKHIKKLFYWVLAEYWVLSDAKGVLFTCEEERLLARESFKLYKANEIVVDYGVQSPQGDPELAKSEFLKQFPQLRDKRIILFLSRIHPKKGCDLLIEAFAQIKELDPHLHLVMAGPDQVGWVSELQKLAEKLGVKDRITWTGMLTGIEKWGAYRTAEVFVLPSHSENFGVVIPEALACGVPVLTTNKVNIWREIQIDGAGLVANDDVEGILSMLQTWLNITEREHECMKNYSIKCFKTRFDITVTVNRLIEKLKID